MGKLGTFQRRLTMARRGFLVVALLFSQPRSLSAEAVGSPASILKKGKWVFGAIGSTLRGRGLTGQAEATAYQVGHFRGYGLTDWLSVYGKLGTAYLTVDDASIKKQSSTSATNKFGFNVVASAQVKVRILENVRRGLEWDGSIQYLDVRSRHQGKNELRWHEGQLATSVAKSFDRITPYLGVKCSVVRAIYRVRENGQLLRQGRYRGDSPVGVFVGSDVFFGDHEEIVLNVETAYLDGVELMAAMTYTF